MSAGTKYEKIYVIILGNLVSGGGVITSCVIIIMRKKLFQVCFPDYFKEFSKKIPDDGFEEKPIFIILISSHFFYSFKILTSSENLHIKTIKKVK